MQNQFVNMSKVCFDHGVVLFCFYHALKGHQQLAVRREYWEGHVA